MVAVSALTVSDFLVGTAGPLQVSRDQAAEGCAAVWAPRHGQNPAGKSLRSADERYLPEAGGAPACAGKPAWTFFLAIPG